MNFKHVCITAMVFSFLFSCKKNVAVQNAIVTQKITRDNIVINPFHFYDSIFDNNQVYLSKQFDYPIGKPNAKGYYNAQKFQENDHLGDDWNGTGGGNTDLGDPIYSISNGYIKSSEKIGGGWGNVIRIVHKYQGKYYESLYAHCDTLLLKQGQWVTRGQQIATIGNADGIYWAHLHLEIRNNIFMDIGGGYSNNTKGYLDPTQFINDH